MVTRPERNFSEGLVLPDGRKVRVLGYDDGSIRFRVSGTPYLLSEAYLQGSTQDHAIIKLVPSPQSPAASSVPDEQYLIWCGPTTQPAKFERYATPAGMGAAIARLSMKPCIWMTRGEIKRLVAAQRINPGVSLDAAKRTASKAIRPLIVEYDFFRGHEDSQSWPNADETLVRLRLK